MHELVVATAVQPLAPTILAWLTPRLPANLMLDVNRVTFLVTTAFVAGGTNDSFEAGVALREKIGLPVDRALLTLLDEVVERLVPAHRIVVGEWATRLGIRFPGRIGDVVEYLDDHGEVLVGRVYALDPILAQALVIRARDEAGVRIGAEQVIANTTQGLYSPIERELGRRYEDAPALMAQANAEEARRKRVPQIAPPAPVSPDPPEIA